VSSMIKPTQESDCVMVAKAVTKPGFCVSGIIEKT
jgi:hypothetical protein